MFLNEDGSATITLAATDANNDPLTYSIVSGTDVRYARRLNPLTRQITYTPGANLAGNDHFTFKVVDPLGLESNAVVSLKVQPINDIPIANAATLSTQEDTPLNGQATGSDFETPAGELVFNLVSGPAVGSLVFNANGSFLYTPTANFDGAVTFTYGHRLRRPLQPDPQRLRLRHHHVGLTADGPDTSLVATITIT